MDKRISSVVKLLLLIVATILSGAAIGNFGAALGNQLNCWLEISCSDAADLPMEAIPPWVISATIWFLLSTGLMVIVARARKQFFSLRAVLRRSAASHGRKAVIMGLSFGEMVTDADGRFDENVSPLLKELVRAGFDKASLPVADMAKTGLLKFGPDGLLDKEASPGGHTWVQNLRALRGHVIGKERLSVIIICPSRESARYAPEFKAFLETMLSGAGKDWVGIYINDMEPDYSNFEDVRDALQHARDLCIEKAGADMRLEITDADICIDATSGTAAFSIAAAILTLNHDLVYSYVTSYVNGDKQKGTGPRGGEARVYDAMIDIATFIA